MYYIRHLISTRNGNKIVELKNVYYERCRRCKKDIPSLFYGHDTKCTFSPNAIYKYTSNDIIGEYSNVRKGFVLKPCNATGCNKRVQ